MLAICDFGLDDEASLHNVDDDEERSDDDEHDLPVDMVTPKRPRLTLSDCFRRDTMASSPSKSFNKVYDSVSCHVKLSELLGMTDSTQSTPTDSISSAPVGGFLDLDKVKHWHPNRVWAFVWTNILEVSFPMEPKRLRSKQTDWRRYLNSLHDEAIKPMVCRVGSLKRLRAMDVFHRMVARLTGQSWRNVKGLVRTMWARATEQDQFRWHAFGTSLKDPDIARRTESFQKKAKPAARCLDGTLDALAVAGSPVKMFEACTGIMLTYNIGLGLKSPEVLSLVQDRATPAVFIKFFESSVFHQASFDSFWTFLLELGAKLRFKTIGACMELSENAETPGRVHLHAYLGTGIKGGTGSMCSIVRANIVEDDLEYQGVRPFPRPTNPKKNHPKTVFDATCNGLYYVIADKTTTIMRKATFWHIQDWRDYIGTTIVVPCFSKAQKRHDILHNPSYHA